MMDTNLILLGIYLLGGGFLILLIMYIVKTRIDRQFRNKMIPLLKKQKSTIDELEKDRDDLSSRNTELKKELNIQKNQQAIQDTEYEKIWIILKKGLLDKYRESATVDTGQKPGTKKQPADELRFRQQIEAIENWFEYKYLKKTPEEKGAEVTELLLKISNQLNTEFANKKLNFVCHLGEPIQVQIPQEIFEYISLTFGRLIGDRSVSGNTLYFDTGKTGKKCLISLEDSGPGEKDQEIKSFFQESWMPNQLPDLPDKIILPVLVSKELIHQFKGNSWYSRIHEIGIKITYSIPLTIG
jgi:hypothetical protein